MILASRETIDHYMASGIYSDMTLMDRLAVHVENDYQESRGQGAEEGFTTGYSIKNGKELMTS